MIIGLVGDTHGQTGAVWPAMRRASEAGAELLIVMGDVGWWPRDAVEEFFDPLQRGLAVCGMAGAGLDGNHDYPGDGHDRHGYLAWTAQQPDLTPGAFVRLDRGARFEIDGCSFLACGGAVSIDKSHRRTEGPPERCSWWAQEAVADDDVEAVRSACADGRTVDVLLTHDAVELPPGFEPAGDAAYRAACDIQRQRMRTIRDCTAPSLHIHGHFHEPCVYTRTLSDGRDVRTVGLAADGYAGSLYLLDTALALPFESPLSGPSI